ncbi:MAG: NrdH-redoxin [Anaerolineae bacterium CG_4_9_14_3_um_filter_57_17]|nr:glutaredoxin family protein [bacterium]NCT22180.1 glutaredoxin family protein [bacterium]OIO85405.1 MAG: NrdH-redoxin [Anaerolineae bacterium CG2_30_57_67]PJB64169.1 MAG: NrdH-redoxin [Anaerolineae bacterium CG_4_9_14_3_um_filter_57_17]
MSDLYTRAPSGIVLYGTSWCGDCRRARRILGEMNAAYQDIDIEADPQAARFVEELNHGSRSVPTIIFPDGAILIEPDNDSLRQKLSADANR